MGKNLSIFNFNKYPKACCIAFVLIVFTFVGGSYFLDSINALPAPMLTGHPSIDEKLRYLRNNEKIRDVTLAIIGSSEGIDNVSTEIMKKIPQLGQNYFNFAVRGVHIYGVSELWQILSQYYRPKVVIICMSPMAYRWNNHVQLEEGDIKDYLEGKNPLAYYFKYRGMHFINRILSIRQLRKSNRSFRTVNFDEGGGAYISDDHEPPYPGNWNRRFNYEYNAESYEVLEEMLGRFEQEGVEVIYVVSPVRQNMFDDELARKQVIQHWEKVRSILNDHNMAFINMHEKLGLDDSYFADVIHLNYTSAKYFTEKLLDELKFRQLITYSPNDRSEQEYSKDVVGVSDGTSLQLD